MGEDKICYSGGPAHTAEKKHSRQSQRNGLLPQESGIHKMQDLLVKGRKSTRKEVPKEHILSAVSLMHKEFPGIIVRPLECIRAHYYVIKWQHPKFLVPYCCSGEMIKCCPTICLEI